MRTWGDTSFLILLMVYPSGAFVTVSPLYFNGGMRGSDSGPAYRKLESFGMRQSFSRIAQIILDEFDLILDKHSIFIDVAFEHVERAILDVSAESRDIAKRVLSRVNKDDEVLMSDSPQEKITSFFGQVFFDTKVPAASSNEREMSAITDIGGNKTIFHPVSNFPVVVYNASTAFHDIAVFEISANFVSVVKSKSQMAQNVGLLAQARKVVELNVEDGALMGLAA